MENNYRANQLAVLHNSWRAGWHIYIMMALEGQCVLHNSWTLWSNIYWVILDMSSDWISNRTLSSSNANIATCFASFMASVATVLIVWLSTFLYLHLKYHHHIISVNSLHLYFSFNCTPPLYVTASGCACVSVPMRNTLHPAEISLLLNV